MPRPSKLLNYWLIQGLLWISEMSNDIYLKRMASTPLHFAAMENDSKIAKLLIESGAIVDAKDE